MSWYNFLLSDLVMWQERLREMLGTSYLYHAPLVIQYVVGFAVVAMLLIVLVLIARRTITDPARALIPDSGLTIRTFFELIVEASMGLLEGSMSRKNAVFFLPLIGTAGLMIFFSNIMGIIPGFEPATGNFNTTIAMGIVIFLSTWFFGIKENGLGFFAHFFGPIRKWWALPLMLFMFAIELVSHIARPLTLGVRLMGNMFADHMVVAIFTLIFPLLLPVPFVFLGVFVSILQAAVFCILSTVYIGMAISHEEH